MPLILYAAGWNDLLKEMAAIPGFISLVGYEHLHD